MGYSPRWVAKSQTRLSDFTSHRSRMLGLQTIGVTGHQRVQNAKVAIKDGA